MWQIWLPAPIRRLSGVRARIWTIFLASAAITLMAALLAIAAFRAADSAADRIAKVSVPTLQRVADAIEHANQVASLAPSQMAASNEAELKSLLLQGHDFSRSLEAAIATLPNPQYQQHLAVYIEPLKINLDTMNQVALARLTLRERIDTKVENTTRLTDALRLVLSPLGLAQVTDGARSRQIFALQEIKTEIHLLYSLIVRMAYEPDRLRVGQHRNAASDALDRIELRLKELPSGGVRDVVVKATQQLHDIIFADANVALLQLQQLEARQQIDDLLESNRSLMAALRRLQREVQADTTVAVTASNDSMLNAFSWAQSALIALSLAAVAGALLLGWLFAGPLLGSRLVALAHNVETMAGGNLTISIADKGQDEIGRLADALRQFQHLARERERIESELSRLANFDGLTSLPNRHLLHQRANDLIDHCARDGVRFAVLFVDLDRFKPVNDSQGHEVGDSVLHEAASRLQNSVRRTDMLGRLGGDEFVLLMEIGHSIVDAELVAEKIITMLREPFRVANKSFFIGASIGISRYPDDGQDFAELLRKADAAMYSAKAMGGNSTAIYREEMNVVVSERLALEAGLRHALENNALEVWYQPKAQLKDGLVCGAEALIRWRRDGKLISPAEFIPLAEETGLIVPIGAFVLRQAAADAVRWRVIAGTAFTVAVNLSSRQLVNPELLALTIAEAIQHCGLPASALELEVTESLLMQNLTAASQLLRDLRAQGHRIAVDDFGTGYASLSYVKKLPIDILKIDQTFVRGLPTDAGDIAVASALIGLGQALNFTLVAEGVETEAQRNYLRERGCQIMQGYLLSKPRPAAEFGPWLQARQHTEI